jgi:pimeloyl-ACP methyl ester carboxylesterase
LPFAELTDVTLFFTDDGIDGAPIVLLHGWGCDSHDWSWQVGGLLAEGFRVIAPDLRVHGRSTVPLDRYSPQDCAHDVADLLAKRNTDSAIAIGHSFGAFVASALAVEFPSLVGAMIAVDPGYGRDDSLPDTASDLEAELSVSEDGGPAGQVFEHMDGEGTPMGLRVWHRRRVLGTPHRALLMSLHSLYQDHDEFASRRGAEAYLPRRRCPVLTIHTSPSQADWEETLFRHPASRTVVWHGTGPWLHQERPTEFNRLIVDWLRGLSLSEIAQAEGVSG